MPKKKNVAAVVARPHPRQIYCDMFKLVLDDPGYQNFIDTMFNTIKKHNKKSVVMNDSILNFMKSTLTSTRSHQLVQSLMSKEGLQIKAQKYWKYREVFRKGIVPAPDGPEGQHLFTDVIATVVDCLEERTVRDCYGLLVQMIDAYEAKAKKHDWDQQTIEIPPGWKTVEEHYAKVT